MTEKILIINTGGTIAMQKEPQTLSIIETSKNPVLQYATLNDHNYELIIAEPFNLPSPHITPQEMLQIKELIEQKMTENLLKGIVITHGTDTLEETAYFLELTLKHTIPVVITGAMRPSNELSSDGPSNFTNAIRVATDKNAYNKGVMVVLNEEIHSAVNVTKAHTSQLTTFQSPHFGSIGTVTKSKIFFHNQPTTSEKYVIKHVDKNVPLIKAYAGLDSKIFEALALMPIDGLVIEAFGQGNLPKQTLPGIKKLLTNNIPIVVVSRCFTGFIEGIYGYEAGGKQLKDLGVIFANGLNGQKARIKLLICLCSENKFTTLEKNIFQLNKQ